MHFVGIDWADDDHMVCILSDIGNVVSLFKITNDLIGFHQLDEKLRQFSPIKISIERIDGLLVDYLIDSSYDVFVVTPHATSAKRGRKSKHDKTDARLLANLLRTHDVECRPIQRPSRLVLELKHKVRLYDFLIQDRQRYANRLSHILKFYYPNMLRIFSNIHIPLAIAFMKRFPDADTVRSTSLEDFTQFFQGRHYNSKHKIPLFYEQLCASSPLSVDPIGYRYQMLAQLAILEALNSQLFPLEKEIDRLFSQHPEAKWWKHFPGMGTMTAARLLSYIGDNRDRFPTYQALQATAGTAPITQQSGHRSVVLFRNSCSKPLRKSVIDWAQHSIAKSIWAKSYFNQQCSRGHKKSRAYRALANRWMRVFWTLWQSGKYYNPTVHEEHSHLLRDSYA